MRNILLFLLFSLTFLLTPGVTEAKYDPQSVPNNLFGIHILEVNDLSDAAKLVNSKGGSWGYVTVVIQENDRDLGKWQCIFDQMRRLKLIPLVRIATHIDGDSWTRPYKDSPQDWAKFLNSLNWPTENRYVILFNEPNHANEWGKVLDPGEFARTMMAHAHALRKESGDFFILPAGLDFSASTDGRSMDAATYLTLMLAAEPTMFDYLDGWTSHSYPNPAFSGPPTASGRGTVRSFLWELNYIKNLGITKKLPVFITETGWVHSQGVTQNRGLLSPEQVASHVTSAASSVWQSGEVVAVTPFVLNYQGLPFDHFSWRKLGSSDFFPHYAAYQDVTKITGKPKQRHKYTIDKKLLPESLIAGSTYTLSALLKNEGQAIVSERDGFELVLTTDTPFVHVFEPLPVMEPGQFGSINLHVETPLTPGTYPYTLQLIQNEVTATFETGTISLLPPPSIELSIQLGWKPITKTTDATVLIYDHHTPIHKINGVEFKNGKAVINELRNIVPGYPYRIVVLVPYYLPRQTVTQIKRDTTKIQLSRMYPFDFNQDGMLSPRDLVALVTLSPGFVSGLFFGP
jgi:hypothetical protein